jgi:hypothetical protein
MVHSTPLGRIGDTDLSEPSGSSKPSVKVSVQPAGIEQCNRCLPGEGTSKLPYQVGGEGAKR